MEHPICDLFFLLMCPSGERKIKSVRSTPIIFLFILLGTGSSCTLQYEFKKTLKIKLLENMKKDQFIHHYNYKLDSGEVNDEPSLTIPDQSDSILDIMRKAQQGLLSDRIQTYFDENPDFDDQSPLEDLDLTHLDDAREIISRERNKYISKQKKSLKTPLNNPTNEQASSSENSTDSEESGNDQLGVE